jgi:lipoprotein-releasing system permease protein
MERIVYFAVRSWVPFTKLSDKIFKALGANNWSVRKIFLYNALYLIARGLFWGNVIGILLLLVQQEFGVIKLNPENYYVNQAPVYFNWGYIMVLNGLTIVICFTVLLIPSYIITKISPVKAIRYDWDKYNTSNPL